MSTPFDVTDLQEVIRKREDLRKVTPCAVCGHLGETHEWTRGRCHTETYEPDLDSWIGCSCSAWKARTP